MDHKGEVRKIMPKNILVIAYDKTGELDEYSQWKIHPSFLERVDQ